MKKIPLEFQPMPPDLMLERAKDFYTLMKHRRTVRDFSRKPVPQEIIEQALLNARSEPCRVCSAQCEA
jgi:iodotyrosine deiodinase